MQAAPVIFGVILGYFTCTLLRRKRINVIRGAGYKFVMVVRDDLHLTKNDLALYCSRAALECYKKTKSMSPETINLWERQGQAKVVLKIRGLEEIMKLNHETLSTGLASVLVNKIHTGQEIDFTVIGIGPGPEEIINQITGHLKLL